jgi:hypothetical protein
MTQYIRDKGLLPSDEVDRLITSTPTEALTQDDFERLSFNWQDWFDSICSHVRSGCNDDQPLLQLA